ncbi:GldM C-terminal domain-containing protein [Flavobacterium swingsii]|uniref:GldM C-terminal domain-containing protein n=1 Tax=Flavobacterium swingsii TaxID=498292 RepID=A0A1I0Y5S9_9FLAO|nr:GldM family protein [Flavobacterium swingsii]SFB08649.1 GldM C-terminal domain-containing protein [Flavobacterium swingsii]
MKKLLFLLLFPIVVFPQNDSISPVKKGNISVVSADRMNVVYRGIQNPISIAVNNAKSYKITGDGVSQNEDGKYVLRAGAGTETKVIVEIEKLDGAKVTEEHIFRIKGLPKPIGTLNDEYSTNGSVLRFTKEELKKAIVNYKMIDFLFNINPEVTQFNLSINNKSITVEGNKFNNEALKIINSAKKRDYLIISNIKTNYMSPEACFPRSPAPISFKVVN